MLFVTCLLGQDEGRSEMTYLSHLPSSLCGAIIVSSLIALSIAGLALFQRLIVGRLRLTEEMKRYHFLCLRHRGVLQPDSRTDCSGRVVDVQPGRKHRFRPLSTRSGSLNRSEIDESDLKMKRGDYRILEIVLIGNH